MFLQKISKLQSLLWLTPKFLTPKLTIVTTMPACTNAVIHGPGGDPVADGGDLSDDFVAGDDRTNEQVRSCPSICAMDCLDLAYNPPPIPLCWAYMSE